MTGTLDKWAVKSILDSLSLLESSQDFLVGLFPAARAATDNNKALIRDIRNKVLDAAVIDIAVEHVAVAERVAIEGIR